MSKGAALVTGAGARLGKAMAIALGEDGFDVAVHYRTSTKGAEDTAEKIKALGGKAVLIQADLAEEASRVDVVARSAKALGAPITLLVNSASTFEDDSAQMHSRENWDFHFEPNLRAPIHLAQQMAAALPSDIKGHVVNLIDQRVLKLNPQFFTYTLSKAALWQATRTMAQAFAPDVRVNAIGPGPTLQSVHQSGEDFQGEAKATLTGEGSSPDEIVRALRYLVSAKSVTGQMIVSDGGQHLLWQTPDLV